MIKCIIWDLDHTLWDGILGENPNVTLRNGVRELIEEFNQRGIIHSIASRNDHEVAVAKLEELNLLQHFVYPQISWNSKSESVRKLIQGLHLRAANILFVDDNPFERDEVSSVYPEIKLNDGSNLEAILNLEEAKVSYSSSEAQQRIKMYKLEEQRLQDEEEYSGHRNEFLSRCNIQLEVDWMQETDLGRVKELIDRTNQMNSSGVRFSTEEILEMVKDPSYRVYMAEVKDRYGSYGRSGLIIVEKNNIDRLLEVKLLIVSCRLMGKGIAQSLLSFISAKAKEEGYLRLRCPFKRNRYNRQMILLYTMNYFQQVKSIDDWNYYELDLAEHLVAAPKWVQLKDLTGEGSR